MDRLPAHFRQGPSQWNDIGNFINNRPKSDAKAHYRAFRDFLRQIHGTPEAGDLEKRTALELLSTVTLPDFQIQTCLKKQRAAVQAAENAKVGYKSVPMIFVLPEA
ncbi:hypothetical protein BX616_009092 [Lobosporangium transversale]|nr:hypothetical protein BX616_009092 [Lobosporangium transversale]